MIQTEEPITLDPLVDFITTIFDPSDTIELRCFSPDDEYGKQRWCIAREIGNEENRDWLRDLNDDGYSVYVGANPRKGFGLAGDINVALARSLFVDFDGGTTPEQALANVTDKGLPRPTIVNNSGHGVHCWWVFNEPFTDMREWTALQKGLIALLGSDPKIHNPERVMRIPGYTNYKKNLQACDSSIVEFGGTVYQWHEVLPLIPKQPAEKPVEPSQNGHGGDIRKCLQAMLDMNVGNENDGSNRLYASACRTVEHDLKDPDAIRCFKAYAFAQPFPKAYTDQQFLDRVRDAEKKTTRGKEATEPAPTPISLGEMWQADSTLAEPIIEGLLRRGEVANLISTSKSYKTYLILCLAISMVVCRQWLERFPCKGGRVLIIDLELQKPSITKRTIDIAKAMYADLRQVAEGIDVISFRGRTGTIDQIEKLLLSEKPGRWDLVIVDPLYKTYPAQFDENSNAQMTMLYRRWERIAEHLNAGLVIVHHGTKGSQSDKRVVDVGAGASAQSRSADCHIALREHETDGAVVLEARVRSFAPVDPMVIRWEYPLWQRAHDLDPSALKTGRKSRNSVTSEPQAKEKPAPWTVERFVSTFLSFDPKGRATIEAEAVEQGLSIAKLKTLLNAAIESGKAHEWTYGGNVARRYAIEPQPITATVPE